MQVRLEVTEGPAAGEIFVFDEPDIFVFGRSTDVRCSIPSDPKVSGTHFMIQINPPDCSLMGLGSRNGTSVNQIHYGGTSESAKRRRNRKQASPVKLRDGDAIVAGQSRFRVGITYELVCTHCGTRFSVDGDAELARRVGTFEGPDGAARLAGVPVCGDCARLASKGTRARPKIVRRAVCSRCGTDVLEEVGIRALAGETDYVCSKCRRSTIHGGEIREALRALRETGEVSKGVGGMGAVYLARDVDQSRLVAIKILLPSVAVRPEAAALFERETEVAAALRHPNIVQIYDRGRLGAVFYCIMEFIDGADLECLVESRGRLPVDEAVDIILQALRGLSHAHESGIVHRDIKPANILLEGRAAPWRAVVTDFGLAKSFEQAGLSGLTTGDAPQGSLDFMPREQIIRYKWLRPTSDVYSMGATLYYALTGRPVKRGLEGDDADMPTAVRAIMNEPVVPVRERDPSVPQALAKVIDRSLREEESRRYQTAGFMERALLRAR